MQIKEMSSEPATRHVTVCLSYEECRDLSNAMYYLVNGKSPDKDYMHIANKCNILFDMVKHGMVMPETMEQCVYAEKNVPNTKTER